MLEFGEEKGKGKKKKKERKDDLLNQHDFGCTCGLLLERRLGFHAPLDESVEAHSITCTAAGLHVHFPPVHVLTQHPTMLLATRTTQNKRGKLLFQ